jgi:hypothetical protein
MTFTTEEDGDIPDASAADIERILRDDAFGKFAILSASETDFIQAGNDWQPGPACEQFLQQHDSDPWLLEYRDGSSSRQFRATEQITLDQVRQALLSYLAGTGDWQTTFSWAELDL